MPCPAKALLAVAPSLPADRSALGSLQLIAFGGDYATKSSSSIAASLGTIIAASAAYIAAENTVVPRTLQSH